ncbi:MAG: SpoIID/LytB domain-containing protein [Acidobacteria bacterium]|nr:SpoIID/LytB domain-containing protein [Acidobacteriota bacterium]
MSRLNPKSVERPRRTDLPGFKNPAALWFVCSILLLIVWTAGCGGRKTKVKRPQPSPATTASIPKAGPAKKPTPELPPKPVIEKPSETIATGKAAPIEYAPGPLIRIGLTTTVREVRISSSGNYLFMEKRPEASQQTVQGEIQIRVEQETDAKSPVYRIQVASFSNADAAEELRRTLEDTLDVPVIVRENSETGTNQVRAGEFNEKDEAQPLLKNLIESGYRDAFLVKEDISSGKGRLILALRGQNDLFQLSRTGFLIQPSSGADFLRLDGKPYRGLLDIFLNKNGRMTVVNQVGTEEYLLGVVPAEISPTSYPEYDAWAALAIAARTYALSNLGRYRSEGFDLSDDTNTQVYEGVSVEKDETNEAVRRTSGLAVYYDDKLINAMYMSTCGGRTEDFSNVYDAPEVPYLKSVFCTIESGPEKGATVLESRHDLDGSVLSDDGSIANRNIEFARVLGLIGNDSNLSQDFLTGPARRDEIIRWLDKAGHIAGKKQADDPPVPADLETRAGFLQYAAESFFGADEIQRKLSRRDLDYYIGNLRDGDSVPASARYALAYLMQAGLWRSNSDNTARPDGLIRRSDAIFLLLNWIESVRPDILQKGLFVTARQRDGERVISIKRGNRAQEFRLSENPCMFRLDGGRTTPVSSLKILGNEKVTFHVGPSDAIDFLEVELSPNGASSDRYSPAFSWDVTLTHAVVGERLRPLAGNIGQFQDLKPARLGNSGRVVQVQVIGSRRSVVLNGYKVRGALKLKDTLYTITRDTRSDGSIASFTFHGRGYGHGVGLCQVGAFGMARAGHGYEEILKTYYQGVEIKKAY